MVLEISHYIAGQVAETVDDAYTPSEPTTAIQLPDEFNVLDVACGEGGLALCLYQVLSQNFEWPTPTAAPVVTGIDIDSHALAVASAHSVQVMEALGVKVAEQTQQEQILDKYAHKSPPIYFRHSFADKVQVADHSQDVITCQLGLQYFERPLQCLKEMERIWRAGPSACALIAVWGQPGLCPLINLPVEALRVEDENFVSHSISSHTGTTKHTTSETDVPAGADGGRKPGPFAFSDVQTFEEILQKAGLAKVSANGEACYSMVTGTIRVGFESFNDFYVFGIKDYLIRHEVGEATQDTTERVRATLWNAVRAYRDEAGMRIINPEQLTGDVAHDQSCVALSVPCQFHLANCRNPLDPNKVAYVRNDCR
eukprot:CFRG0612T1